MRSGQDFASGRLHAIKSVCGWVESISRKPEAAWDPTCQNAKAAPQERSLARRSPCRDSDASAATRERAAKLVSGEELWTSFFSDDCNTPYFPLPQLAPTQLGNGKGPGPGQASGETPACTGGQGEPQWRYLSKRCRREGWQIFKNRREEASQVVVSEHHDARPSADRVLAHVRKSGPATAVNKWVHSGRLRMPTPSNNPQHL